MKKIKKFLKSQAVYFFGKRVAKFTIWLNRKLPQEHRQKIPYFMFLWSNTEPTDADTVTYDDDVTKKFLSLDKYKDKAEKLDPNLFDND